MRESLFPLKFIIVFFGTRIHQLVSNCPIAGIDLELTLENHKSNKKAIYFIQADRYILVASYEK